MEPVEAMTVKQYDTNKLMDLVQNQLIQIVIVSSWGCISPYVLRMKSRGGGESS